MDTVHLKSNVSFFFLRRIPNIDEDEDEIDLGETKKEFSKIIKRAKIKNRSSYNPFGRTYQSLNKIEKIEIEEIFSGGANLENSDAELGIDDEYESSGHINTMDDFSDNYARPQKNYW